MKKLTAILLCAALALSLLVLPAAAMGEREQVIWNDVLEKNLSDSGAKDVQSWIDTALAGDAGTGAEWYIMALLASGEEYDYSAYVAALEKYVHETEESSAATRQKLALMFLMCGAHSDYIEKVSDSTVGGLGLMSWVFGLHLANNGVEMTPGKDEIVDTLLSMQFEDGGWAVTGDKGDPDATSMVLQAFSPMKDDPKVAAAIEPALSFLSEKQLPCGGYVSFGMECPDSIAQVMIALAALDIDAFTDERFIKDGNMLDALEQFRLPDGTFAHSKGGKYNALSTLESFAALAAYDKQQRGEGSLYIAKGAPTREAADVLAEVEAAKGVQLDKRTVLCIAVGVIALATCAILFAKGKRHWKNFAFVLGAAAAAIYLIFSVRIEKTEDYYGTSAKADGKSVTATISIRCDKVAGERDFLPEDGWILPTTEITLNEGSTAFDQLVAAAKQYGIHIDKEESKISSAYMKGIANLYEYDFGELSGWMYCVNGDYADVGCGEYELHEGDVVEWRYTLELGRDIGDDYYLGETAD